MKRGYLRNHLVSKETQASSNRDLNTVEHLKKTHKVTPLRCFSKENKSNSDSQLSFWVRISPISLVEALIVFSYLQVRCLNVRINDLTVTFANRNVGKILAKSMIPFASVKHKINSYHGNILS